MFKIDRDPRITPVGRLIRRTSIDELPQLLNVLRGQMSLVGPRPLIPQESAHLAESWQIRRLDLRPGMTGLWQISGRSDISFRDMVRLDYQYVTGWSVARDAEILLATLPAVLGGRGAY
jgi:lipopolysaccharide/colanic/teichoic acid biosynthesis glycosyltransferase